MVTQETIALSTPSCETNNIAFTQSIQNGKKKQQEELLRLGAILQLVEEEVASAKSGVSSAKSGNAEEGKIVELQAGNTDETQGPSGTKFEDSMASMALALQMLQVLIAKYGNEKADQESKISDAQLQATKENLQKLQEQLKKIAQEQKKQKTISIVEKVLEGLIAVVTVIVGAVLLQPEIIAMGLISGLAATGAFDEATKGVAKLLMDCGVSKENSQWIAAIIVCVIVVAASVASMNFASAAEETADTAVVATEDITEAAETAADSAGSIAQSAKQAANTAYQSVKTLLKSIQQVSKALGPFGRMGLFSTMNLLSSTQMIQKIYDAEAKGKGVSKEKREKVENDISIGLGIATFLVSIFAASGAASGAGKGSKATGKIAGFLTRTQRISLNVANGGELGAGLADAAITVQEGDLQAVVAKYQADIQTLSTLSQIVSTEIQESQQAQVSAEKSQQTGDKSLGELMNGLKGFANAFAYSPV